jgi:hypothetical protein
MKKLAVIIVTGLSLSSPQAKGPKFEQIYPLKAEEGVFAYSRISPDGKTLAYASEVQIPNTRRIQQTVTVVDLPTKKIVFEEPGIDAYWSDDGTRMIYSSQTMRDVSIRYHPSGKLVRNVAPSGLGDYYSWAVRDGKDLILTINSNYYYLDGDKAVIPHSSVPPCPGIGVGERPMISHDGKLITTFVRGTVVVRSLTGCDVVFDTGIDGAKSDFSWDSRYVAMQRAKVTGEGYEVVVIDLQKKTIRVVTSALKGSSIFPSWTKDGRLHFRYDSDDYRGFMMASDVLSAPERPLGTVSNQLPANRTWADVFPETKRPAKEWNLVMIWGTWSAHSQTALADLQRAQKTFDARLGNISVATALEPATIRADAERIKRNAGTTLAEIPLTTKSFAHTEARNQIPTTLLFHNGKLVDRRLGPLSYELLTDWISTSQNIKP